MDSGWIESQLTSSLLLLVLVLCLLQAESTQRFVRDGILTLATASYIECGLQRIIVASCRDSTISILSCGGDGKATGQPQNLAGAKKSRGSPGTSGTKQGSALITPRVFISMHALKFRYDFM
jgi:hypothetical protein